MNESPKGEPKACEEHDVQPVSGFGDLGERANESVVWYSVSLGL